VCVSERDMFFCILQGFLVTGMGCSHSTPSFHKRIRMPVLIEVSNCLNSTHSHLIEIEWQKKKLFFFWELHQSTIVCHNEDSSYLLLYYLPRFLPNPIDHLMKPFLAVSEQTNQPNYESLKLSSPSCRSKPVWPFLLWRWRT